MALFQIEHDIETISALCARVAASSGAGPARRRLWVHADAPAAAHFVGLAFAFANIVARMQDMYPAITPADVEIEYRNVGLGYAGDPHGPDVAPLVTVRLKDMKFTPITFLLFGGEIDMPDFRAALTLEDGSGNYSN